MVPQQGTCSLLRSDHSAPSPTFISLFPSPFQFENIKVEEAQNTEVLQSASRELKDLLKQRQHLEIKLQSQHSMVTLHI